MNNEQINDLQSHIYRSYLDAQIERGYYTTRYVLIQAGDRPELHDVSLEYWFDSADTAESFWRDQIVPDDWQIIAVSTSPVGTP